MEKMENQSKSSKYEVKASAPKSTENNIVNLLQKDSDADAMLKNKFDINERFDDFD